MPSFLITPVSSSTTLREHTVEPGSGWFRDKVVIVEVEGLLLNARTGGFLQPTENDVSLFTQQLNKAAGDSAVKAVILRINSPGGTVSASDTMYEELLRFRRKTGKPVVASTQDIAASGGYYIACAADQIVAQPTSVVGSIGVIFNTFDFSGTLAKIGARTDAIKSGTLKDMGSPFKPLTLHERNVMQEMVDEYHLRFRNVVKTGRKLDDQRLAKVDDGRVTTGQQAVALGLADRTGDLHDAIALARELGKAPKADVVLYKRPYGYSGSIYAGSQAPEPRAMVLQLNLPPSRASLPTGFYYLWEP